jgi:hypothetical protein
MMGIPGGGEREDGVGRVGGGCRRSWVGVHEPMAAHGEAASVSTSGGDRGRRRQGMGGGGGRLGSRVGLGFDEIGWSGLDWIGTGRRAGHEEAWVLSGRIDRAEAGADSREWKKVGTSFCLHFVLFSSRDKYYKLW